MALDSKIMIEPNETTCEVSFRDYMGKMGITLTNGYRGVVVKSTVENDLAFSKLRRGVTIKYINNMPMIHHKHAIIQIDECIKNKYPILVETVPARYHNKKECMCLVSYRNIAKKWQNVHDSFHPEWNE
jgi:hypothetical protein